jgi:nucleoside-diphosphate-sugar epimerase
MKGKTNMGDGELYLVTGGAGFIGSHIAEALVKRGDRVRVMDNLITGRRENLAPVADRIESGRRRRARNISSSRCAFGAALRG